ncbi:anti-phage protein Ppl [Acinetobacter baumannii]|uniref:anti-phage protein Ppl n=1 Tax=Acinetobacter baumannii TaxID=470 RepID=UPI00321981B8
MNNIIGSKWYKVDFHCHSPASDDFPRNSTQPKCSNREWLLTQMSNKIDCVILSDHNTAKGLDPIRNTLKELEDENKTNPDNGYRPIVIMPAVELTAPDNTHILAIFREDINSALIEQFIGQLLPPAGQQNHQLVLGTATNIIIRNAKQNSEEILIIPAHVDKPKGVFQNTNQYAVEQIFSEEPHAIELINNSEDLPYQYQKNLIKGLAHVKGSDAHSLEEIGRSYTWVKMTKPSFDGIKIALTNPEQSIIRSPYFPPNLPSEQITKLSILSPLCSNDHEGPLEIELSPWYTSIIGSRGSGKSTLIEAIRLGLQRDTIQFLPSDQLNIVQKFKDGALDNDSLISVEYRKTNELYKLEWSKETSQLYHQVESGEWEKEDTFSTARFPISIYSQKMLYEIATKNDAFLTVIDASEEVNIEHWNKVKLELEEKYKRVCSDHRIAIREVSDLSKIQGQYDDITRKLTLLNDAGLQPLQEALKSFNIDKRKLDEAINSLELTITSLSTLTENIPSITPTIEDTDLGKFIRSARTIEDSLIKDVDGLIKHYQEKILSLRNNPYYLQLSSDITEINHQLNTKVSTLASAHITPDALSSLLSNEQALQKKLENKHVLEEKVLDLAQKKEQVYQDIINHRKKLTLLRNDFINSLNLEDLKIRVLALSCEENSLIAGYQKKTHIERHVLSILDTSNQNSLLYPLFKINKFLPDNETLKYREIEKLKKFHEDHANNIENSTYVSLHGSLKNRIRDMTSEDIDNFMCWFPEDGLDIKFKDNEDQFRQLESASPGQKSASMLSFLMSYGTDPLVLDQPEDDLDCGMLASAVIPAIARNKKKRQIIIVSHSAPIVVNGDADYIIAMKQVSKRLRPYTSGGLQDQTIKDFICNQMEGGELAFKARFNRILG